MDIEEIKAKGAISAVYAEVSRVVGEAGAKLTNLNDVSRRTSDDKAYRNFGANMDAIKLQLDEARELLNEVRKLEQ